MLVVFSPFLMVTLLYKRLVVMYENNLSEPGRTTMELTINYILPSFLFGFCYFGFSRLLFKKLHLVASDVDLDNMQSSEGKEIFADLSYDSEDDSQDGNEQLRFEPKHSCHKASHRSDSGNGSDSGYKEDLLRVSSSGGNSNHNVPLFARKDIFSFQSKKDFVQD